MTVNEPHGKSTIGCRACRLLAPTGGRVPFRSATQPGLAQVTQAAHAHRSHIRRAAKLTSHITETAPEPNNMSAHNPGRVREEAQELNPGTGASLNRISSAAP